jgi:cytochrome c oxidase assembly protein subunit 15
VHDTLDDTPAVPASRPLHVASIVTLCFTFPLIFLGGLVTSHGAGMSVPDWPNSYGYNMFFFPVSRWVGGIFYEHTHRLLGTVVGFCATVMTLIAWSPARTGRGRRILLWTLIGLEAVNAIGTVGMWLFPGAFRLPETARSARAIFPQGAVTATGIGLTIAVAWLCRTREPRRWVRWLATGSLIAVCVQGLLGGMRVDLANLTLAIVHGCFAQLTFCLILLTSIVTGRWWRSSQFTAFGGRPEGARTGAPSGRPVNGSAALTALAFVTTAVIYAQLIIGAIMRHNGAGLAIPDLPLAYGHWLPPTNAAQLAVDNHWRVWNLGLEPVTLPQVWIHYAHRVGALVVSAFVIALAGCILIRRSGGGVAGPARTMLVLLAAQVTLGVCTVHYGKPADIASAHVATGALLLATAVLIAVRTARLRSAPAGASAVLNGIGVKQSRARSVLAQ